MRDLLFVLYVLLALACALHALMNKRDPRSAIGWIALCLFAPVVGAVGYLLLGVNRTERRAMTQPVNSNVVRTSRFGHIHNGLVSAPPPPSNGNSITAGFDGPEVYAQMIQAISAAERRVWLSQYIFEARGIGQAFIEALNQAAARDVEVCVILDRVGALYSLGNTRKKLQRGGVHVAMFLPTRLRPFGWQLNLRNHRKILIIDDDVAFAGGMNIRKNYVPEKNADDPLIRDTHFRCVGPVAHDLALIFREDWYYATGEVLERPQVHEPLLGPTRCRVTVDGPDNSVDLLTVTMLAAMATANRHVRIMMPYFLPPKEIISGLQAAAIRGVKVDIVIPANNNLRVVHWAMHHMFRDLLCYGVRVHYQSGSFNHSKLITIDDTQCIFGSVNMDYRSLRLNFELAIEAWDGELTKTLIDYIEGHISTAAPMTMLDLTQLPFWAKVRNAATWLASPYL